jgi:transcription elongation GreA/GreB family factor
MKKILAEDLVLLDERLAQIEGELFALGAEFNEAVNQSSETWHDNAPFDAARDRQSIINYERKKLVEIRLTATKITTSKAKKIEIGKHVTLSSGLHVFIAGVWSGRDIVDGSKVILVDSPIARALHGKKVGDTVTLLGGEVQVVAIR